mgnify:CR=1 FL=1
MATYGEMVNEVLSIIPRPGQESLIRSKINQIIRFVAGSADYWKALEEVTIDDVTDGVDPAAYIQAIQVESTFRALLYVRYPSAISLNHIQVMDAKDVMHLQKCQQDKSIAYMSGGYLRIKHEVLTSEFDIGYYSYPAEFATDGTDDNSTNWITLAVPGLIVDLTAAYILNLNGDNEDSKRAKAMSDMMQLPYIASQVNGAILT